MLLLVFLRLTRATRFSLWALTGRRAIQLHRRKKLGCSRRYYIVQLRNTICLTDRINNIMLSVCKMYDASLAPRVSKSADGSRRSAVVSPNGMGSAPVRQKDHTSREEIT